MKQIISGKRDNCVLADRFHRMAGCYRYDGVKQRFHAVANTAETIDGIKPAFN